jgi:hypothetical protein
MNIFRFQKSKKNIKINRAERARERKNSKFPFIEMEILKKKYSDQVRVMDQLNIEALFCFLLLLWLIIC